MYFRAYKLVVLMLIASISAIHPMCRHEIQSALEQDYLVHDMETIANSSPDVLVYYIESGVNINELLMQAIFNRRPSEIIQFLLDSSADVNYQYNLYCDTPLLAATRSGQLVTVNLLLENGASVYAQDATRATALDIAQRNGTIGKTEQNFHIVELLKQHNALTVRDIATSDTEMLDYLIRQGLNINELLIDTIAHKRPRSIIAFLLQSGAHINYRRHHSSDTPLLAATRSGQLDTVNLLLENGASVYAQDATHATALDIALRNQSMHNTEDNFSIVNLLISYGSVTAYDIAHSDKKMLEHYIRQGVNVNELLMEAIAHRRPPTIIAFLLNCEAHINYRRHHSTDTPLLAATRSRQVDTVNLLLQCRASVYAQDATGATALDIAQRNLITHNLGKGYKEATDIVDLLLKHHALTGQVLQDLKGLRLDSLSNQFSRLQLETGSTSQYPIT